MSSPRLCFFLTALLLMIAVAAPAGDPFLELSLDEALVRARAEKKLVFLDFFATWCGPCKKLDSTTFADRKVIEWLGEHTVPLKIDVDVEKAVSKRFSVRSMPTLVFLAADGRELERILGYRDSDAFLKTAAEIIEHPEKDAVARAREELETGYWPEAMARHKLATALAVSGDRGQALAELLKANESLGTDPLSMQYRGRLVSDICGLARDYTPAAEALGGMRGQLVAKVESGDADIHDVEQIITIDGGLNQREKTLELYERLRERGDVDEEVLSRLFRDCRGLMLERRDYAGLYDANSKVLTGTLNLIDLLLKQREFCAGDFSSMSATAPERTKRQYESMSEEDKAAHLSTMEARTVKSVAVSYEIARGLDKTADAAVMAEKLLESCPTAEAHHALAAHALRSGKPAEADLGYAGRAVELDRGKHPEYVETRYYLLEYFEGAAEVPSNRGGEDIPAAAAEASPAEDLADRE